MNELKSNRRREAIQYLGALGALTLSPISIAQTNIWKGGIVILVPGIMGSILKRGNDTIWAANTDMISQIIRRSSLDLSTLRPTNNAQNVEKVRATALFETTTLIPGFWQLDGYTETRRILIENLGLKPKENYFEFPYDWRLDNRIAAKQLNEKLSEWLGEWREKNKRIDGKAVLIAHSMGGLVARYACEVLGAWKNVDQIFTLGTPYQGSFKTVDRLANGFVSAGITETLKSFDSVYQLMPTYNCIHDISGSMRSLAALKEQMSEFVDMSKYLEIGKSFHDECNSHAKENLEKHQEKSGMLHITQASSHSTTCSAKLNAGKLIPLDTIGKKTLGGDGTVPGFDYAEPIVTSANTSQTNYCNQLHGAIQKYEPALINICGIIMAKQIKQELSGYRWGMPVSMRVSEFVRLGTPIQFEIIFDSLQKSFGIKVENLNSNEIVFNNQWNSKISFSDSILLKDPGVYRVNLYDEFRALICSDLTCVAVGN